MQTEQLDQDEEQLLEWVRRHRLQVRKVHEAEAGVLGVKVVHDEKPAQEVREQIVVRTGRRRGVRVGVGVFADRLGYVELAHPQHRFQQL